MCACGARAYLLDASGRGLCVLLLLLLLLGRSQLGHQRLVSAIPIERQHRLLQAAACTQLVTMGWLAQAWWWQDDTWNATTRGRQRHVEGSDTWQVRQGAYAPTRTLGMVLAPAVQVVPLATVASAHLPHGYLPDWCDGHDTT